MYFIIKSQCLCNYQKLQFIITISNPKFNPLHSDAAAGKIHIINLGVSESKGLKIL